MIVTHRRTKIFNECQVTHVVVDNFNLFGYSRIREKLAEFFTQLRTFKLENSRLSKNKYHSHEKFL